MSSLKNIKQQFKVMQKVRRNVEQLYSSNVRKCSLYNYAFSTKDDLIYLLRNPTSLFARAISTTIL